jgi:hypothetical protein
MMYVTLIKELEMLNAEKSRGAQLRAHCMHIESNEANTKYFLSQEKSKAESKCMKKNLLENGDEITDSKEILKEQSKFYKDLYTDKTECSARLLDEAYKYFLDDKIPLKCIDNDDQETLDEPITMDELTKAIKALPRNKTPGSDGWNSEFYQFFWSKIKKIVMDSINYGIQNKLSIDQRRGILSLIPKKDKDPRLLKNWRPISLLNTDYKIFAKTMATRLQKVLDSVISHDQHGCLKGRSTHSNIRSTIDIIRHTKERDIPGLLAFIDFEKAFDMVKWPFLFKVLKRMNFGEFFIQCIKTMYADTLTCVSNNGNLGEFFNPSRGIRQGCPISANLFVIVVEILASVIRQSPRVFGIRIGDKTYKISQYADDTCLFLSDEDSLKNVFIILDIFKRCSGLKANREKSEAIWIGASSNFRHKPLGIKWSTKSIKMLGIYINKDEDECTKDNFKERLDKIENIVKLWCLRKMTLKGKILIVNTLLITQMLYVCSVLEPPDWAIQKFKKITMDFIWNNKKPKIKYNCLINAISNGGLKLQDIDSKVKALKLRWMKELLDEDIYPPWKAYLGSKYKLTMGKLPYYNIENIDFEKTGQKFYDNMLHMWADVHYNEPTNSEEVCQQIIWHNSAIRIDNKPTTNTILEQNGIVFIQDLLNNEGNMASRIYLQKKFNTHINVMYFNSLSSAIPKKWKNLIEQDNNSNNYFRMYKCQIMLHDKYQRIEEVQCKDLYWHIVNNKSCRPVSEAKWEEKVGLNFSEERWADVYQNPYGLTKEAYILSLHFKISHRTLACGYNLNIWKIKDNDLCEICLKEVDTIEHYMVACEMVLPFWNSVFKWWKATIGFMFPLDTYDILFGLANETNDIQITQLNFILILGCTYIYRNKQCKKDTNLYEFLIFCKNKLEAKRETFCMQNRESKFITHWDTLYNAF